MRYLGPDSFLKLLLLIVEIKPLAAGTKPKSTLMLALSQAELQAAFAFEQDNTLKSVFVMAIAGEYWTLREINRGSVEQLPIHSLKNVPGKGIKRSVDIQDKDIHVLFKGDDFHPDFDEAWRVIMERFSM